MPKGSLAWTLLDSLALSLSLTLVLPHIIVCFTNFFFTPLTELDIQWRAICCTGYRLFYLSHFHLNQLVLIFFLILIYIFLILHEASTLKKGREYLKFYILMSALISPLSSFIFMLKSFITFIDSIGILFESILPCTCMFCGGGLTITVVSVWLRLRLKHPQPCDIYFPHVSSPLFSSILTAATKIYLRKRYLCIRLNLILIRVAYLVTLLYTISWVKHTDECDAVCKKAWIKI